MKIHTSSLLGASLLFLFSATATCPADPLPPLRIMPLGDSITDGSYTEAPGDPDSSYRNALHDLLLTDGYEIDFVGTEKDANNPGRDKDHQAVPGITIEEIRAELPFWIKSVEDPDIVLLHAGTNDFAEGASPADVLARMRNLIRDLSSLRPHTKILVSSLILRTDFPAVEANQAAFDAALPQLVSEQSALGRQVFFVDMETALLAGDLLDGLHPNSDGYGKMADEWYTAIVGVIDPEGSPDPPAIARVSARESLGEIKVTFSKPLEDAAANPSYFALSGGAVITAASIDPATKRTITLTTGADLSSGTFYTLTVNDVRDRLTPVPNEIEIDSTSGFISRSVLDGSFEAGGGVWTSTGNQAVVDILTYSAAPATHGTKLLIFNGNNSAPNGVISQVVPTEPGRIYRLEFDMGVAGSAADTQKLKILATGEGINPAVLLSHTELLANPANGKARWITKSLEFEADGAETTLSFQDLSSTTSGIDLLVDDIRIEAAGTNGGASSLLINGNFETGEILPGEIETVLESWSASGGAIGYLTDPPSYVPSDGSRLVVFNSGNDTFDGSISQTFTTEVGKAYLLSFDLGITGDAGQQQRLLIGIESGLSQRSWQTDITAPGSNNLWTSKGMTFIADSLNTTLTFSDGSGTFGSLASGTDMLLDHVSVTEGTLREMIINSRTENMDPITGVNILVDPSDANGNSVGDTTFSRYFTDGAVVSLTAPVTAGGYQFKRWQKNGLDLTFNKTATQQIVGEETLTAVYGVNVIPVASNDAYFAETGSPLSVNPDNGLLINDSDGDEDPLTAVLVDPPLHGSVIVTPEGGFTYTPDPESSEPTDSFTYKANDGVADSNTATVNLTFLPRTGGLLIGGGFEQGEPADFGSLNGWIATGELIGYTTNTPYTPTQGSRMAVFNAGGDNFDGQISQTFNTIIGQTYLLQFDLGVVGAAGRKQRMNISVLSGGTDISWQENVTAGGFTSSTWSSKAYTFVADSTETTLTFTDVSDSVPPTGNPSNADMLLDDVRVVPGALRTLTVNSSPTSGINIIVSPLDENSAGDGVTGFTRSYNDGASVTLTAPSNDGGANVFQKWVLNGTDLTVSPTAVFTIAGDQTLTAVYAASTPPVAADDFHVMEAGATLTVPAPGVLENDTDAESDPLTAVLDNAPPGIELTLGSDGGFTYIAGLEDAGIQTFTYLANDGESNSAPATVSINVVPRTGGLLANGSFEQGLNYPGFDDFFLLYGWTVIAGDPFGYGENAFPFATYEPIQGNRTAVFNGGSSSYTDEISQTFPTIPGQTYLIEFHLGISGTLGSEQKMEISASGAAASPWGEIIASQGPALTHWEAKSLSFVATGTETTLTFRDASGDGDPEMGNPEGTDMMLDYVRVYLSASNLPPVAVDDSGSVNEGGSVILDLAANDSDADDGLDLTSIAIVTGPANGSLIDNGDGTVTYTHNGSETTSDSFTYTIDDISGATSNTASVSVTVTPQNDTPVASDDSGSVNEGGSVILDLAANDSDADDGLDLTSIAIVTGPANGSLLDNGDGTVTYNHDGSETTGDSFTYTIDDLTGATSNTATISITVTPQNDAPVANDDSGNVNEGGSVILDLAANDSDADDSLDLTSIAIVAGPANGSLLDNGDGTVTYTHDGSETTSDSFTYTIDDISGATSNTASVNITVAPQNDAPVAVSDAYSTDEDTLLTVPALYGVLANDTDDGPGTLTATLVQDASSGTLSLAPDGGFTFTPAENFNGGVTFTYKAGDGEFESNIVTVTITVNSVDDPPVADDQTVSLNEDTSLPITLTGSDDGGGSLLFAVLGGPSHGTLKINGAVATYTPDKDYYGPDAIYFIAFTFSGGPQVSSTATVSIMVNSVNDAPVANDDSGNVNEGGSVILNLATNDSDADDGLDLTSIAIVTGPANGSLLDNGDGTVTYTHDGSETTSDSFTYTIEDISGAVSNTATVNITVLPVPDNDFSAWLTENGLPAGPAIDTDKDSIDNIIEYIIGGDPVNSNDTDLLPSSELVTADPDGDTNSSSYLLFTYRRTNRASIDGTIIMAAEWSTDLLSPWNDAASTAGVVILEQPHPEEEGVELIKVYIPQSLEQNGRLFVRLAGGLAGTPE